MSDYRGELTVEEERPVFERKLIAGSLMNILRGNLRAGKPWLARLKGLDPKFKYAREFLRTRVLDDILCADVSKVEKGDILEWKYSASHRHNDEREYLYITEKTSERIRYILLSETEVYQLFTVSRD